jgi:hypothetical protein
MGVRRRLVSQMEAAMNTADDAVDWREFDDWCHECEHLRLEGPDPQESVVRPVDGGGWQAWTEALLRLLHRIGGQPTQCIVISQDVVTQRSVQALIGHGTALVQASSNVYLTGSSRLQPAHEELLTLLGWQPPHASSDDPEELPANWSLPLIRGDWTTMTEIVASTLISVFGFTEYLPVAVRTFPAVSPCKACSWPEV